MPVAVTLTSSAVIPQTPGTDHIKYWTEREHASVWEVLGTWRKSNRTEASREMAPASDVPTDLHPDITFPDDLEGIEPMVTPAADVILTSIQKYLPQDVSTACPHVLTSDVKNERESPTGSKACYPGTSAFGGSVVASSSCSAIPMQPSSSVSPTAPVIPLTALALCASDTSDSCTDAEDGVNYEPASPSVRKEKELSHCVAEGFSTTETSVGKVLDRRKPRVSISDQDSNESDEGEVNESGRSSQDKLERRRLSNRVAAQKCRQRQRQHYRGLTKEIQEWECKNTSLNYEVRQLQKELKQLQSELDAHEAVCTKTKRQ